MPLRGAGKRDGDLGVFLSLTKNATEPLVGEIRVSALRQQESRAALVTVFRYHVEKERLTGKSAGDKMAASVSKAHHSGSCTLH